MKRELYDSHCVVCKKPCRAPRGNFHANSVSICKRKKCQITRKTELQKERRRQRILFPKVKKSKHDSHAKGSKASREARQKWKSGLTHVPI